MSLGSAMGEMLHSYCLRIGVDLEHLDAGERKKLDECLAVGVDYIKAQDKELADRRAKRGSAAHKQAAADRDARFSAMRKRIKQGGWRRSCGGLGGRKAPGVVGGERPDGQAGGAKARAGGGGARG